MDVQELNEALLAILSKHEGEELPPDIQPLLEFIADEMPGNFADWLHLAVPFADFARRHFSDEDIIDYRDLDEDTKLDDAARVKHGRTLLESELENYDHAKSIHVHQVRDPSGATYLLGCIATPQGYTWDFEWIGVFATIERFCEKARQDGYLLAGDLESLPADAILERWEDEPMYKRPQD